jgi:hypothetical protein
MKCIKQALNLSNKEFISCSYNHNKIAYNQKGKL